MEMIYGDEIIHPTPMKINSDHVQVDIMYQIRESGGLFEICLAQMEIRLETLLNYLLRVLVFIVIVRGITEDRMVFIGLLHLI